MMYEKKDNRLIEGYLFDLDTSNNVYVYSLDGGLKQIDKLTSISCSFEEVCKKWIEDKKK